GGTEAARHRNFGRERHAEIAVGELPDPGTVLNVDRPVHAQLVVERLDVVGTGERPEHVATYVARQQLRGGKDEHAKHEQRDERESESLQQETGDDKPPPDRSGVGRYRLGERRLAEEHRALWVGIVTLD